ncbi:MAG: hypothetical protein ABH831_00125 [Candidatus Nealsonbacteria bacterium]
MSTNEKVEVRNHPHLLIAVIIALLIIGGTVSAIKIGPLLDNIIPVTNAGTTTTSQAIIAETATTPASSSQEMTGTVVEITAEALLTQLIADPNKYTIGTVFRVEATKIQNHERPMSGQRGISFGPEVDDFSVWVTLHVSGSPNTNDPKDVIQEFTYLGQEKIVFEGTYYHLGAGGPAFKNPKIIAKIP